MTQIINKIGISYFTYQQTNVSVRAFFLNQIFNNVLALGFFLMKNVAQKIKTLLLIIKYFNSRQLYFIC